MFYSSTGLVYNPRMKEHRDDVNPYHPEQPERIGRIWSALEERGYSKRCTMVKVRLGCSHDCV